MAAVQSRNMRRILFPITMLASQWPRVWSYMFLCECFLNADSQLGRTFSVKKLNPRHLREVQLEGLFRVESFGGLNWSELGDECVGLERPSEAWFLSGTLLGWEGIPETVGNWGCCVRTAEQNWKSFVADEDMPLGWVRGLRVGRRGNYAPNEPRVTALTSLKRKPLSFKLPIDPIEQGILENDGFCNCRTATTALLASSTSKEDDDRVKHNQGGANWPKQKKGRGDLCKSPRGSLCRLLRLKYVRFVGGQIERPVIRARHVVMNAAPNRKRGDLCRSPRGSLCRLLRLKEKRYACRDKDPHTVGRVSTLSLAGTNMYLERLYDASQSPLKWTGVSPMDRSLDAGGPSALQSRAAEQDLGDRYLVDHEDKLGTSKLMTRLASPHSCRDLMYVDSECKPAPSRRGSWSRLGHDNL